MDYAIHNARSLFKQIFSNGYVPLPNADKRCLFPAWQNVVVDQRQVNLWARSRRWPAIGLRIEPPLVVVDIDVLDERLAQGLAQRLPVHGLLRIGRAPKMAFFMRLADGPPFYRIATRRWAADLRVEKPAWSAVEIFAGGGGGKQFGAFGPHETDKDGRPVRFYQWPGGSPADTPIAALPAISVAQCYDFVNMAERVFAAAGWHVDEFTKSGAHQIERAFDLTDAMTFEGEFDSWTLAELEIEARAAMVLGTQIKITGSFTGDPHSARSLRCRVGISPHHDRVYIHDFKTGTTHYPAELAELQAAAEQAQQAAESALFDYTRFLGGKANAQGADEPDPKAHTADHPDHSEVERRARRPRAAQHGG